MHSSTHQAQKREFRNYISGLLGESEGKNLSQIASNAVGMTYHRLHHFLTEAPWSVPGVNQRRLKVMNQCSQTRFGLDICLSPAISPKTLMIRPFSIGMLAAAISISGQLDASIIYCQQVQNQACTAAKNLSKSTQSLANLNKSNSTV
jgi:hypothetical protein